eukprot:1186352-Prorocentrum_minimum.AAC.12
MNGSSICSHLCWLSRCSLRGPLPRHCLRSGGGSNSTDLRVLVLHQPQCNQPGARRRLHTCPALSRLPTSAPPLLRRRQREHPAGQHRPPYRLPHGVRQCGVAAGLNLCRPIFPDRLQIPLQIPLRSPPLGELQQVRDHCPHAAQRLLLHALVPTAPQQRQQLAPSGHVWRPVCATRRVHPPLEQQAQASVQHPVVWLGGKLLQKEELQAWQVNPLPCLLPHQPTDESRNQISTRLYVAICLGVSCDASTLVDVST